MQIKLFVAFAAGACFGAYFTVRDALAGRVDPVGVVVLVACVGLAVLLRPRRHPAEKQ